MVAILWPSIIEGLSTLAVVQVRANLIDSSGDRMKYRMHERDRRVFEELMAKVLLAQVRRVAAWSLGRGHGPPAGLA